MTHTAERDTPGYCFTYEPCGNCHRCAPPAEEDACRRVVIHMDGREGTCGDPLPCWRHPEQTRPTIAERLHRFEQEASHMIDHGGNLVGYFVSADQWRTFRAALTSPIPPAEGV